MKARKRGGSFLEGTLSSSALMSCTCGCPWVRSILDPTWTRPTNIGWKVEGPKTDRWRQSVESVSSSGDARVSSVGVESCQILQTSLDSAKTSLESAKTHFIYTKNHQDHEITIRSGRRTWDLHPI